jgi:hypothetical protein
VFVLFLGGPALPFHLAVTLLAVEVFEEIAISLALSARTSRHSDMSCATIAERAKQRGVDPRLHRPAASASRRAALGPHANIGMVARLHGPSASA